MTTRRMTTRRTKTITKLSSVSPFWKQELKGQAKLNDDDDKDEEVKDNKNDNKEAEEDNNEENEDNY